MRGVRRLPCATSKKVMIMKNNYSGEMLSFSVLMFVLVACLVTLLILERLEIRERRRVQAQMAKYIVVDTMKIKAVFEDTWKDTIKEEDL